MWGRTAEIAGQYLTKGQETYIEGRLETRKYTAKDGTERRVTEVIGEVMQLGSRAGQGGGGSYQKPTNSFQPAQNSAPASQPAKALAGQAVEEEIPTINLDEEQDEIRIEDVPF